MSRPRLSLSEVCACLVPPLVGMGWFADPPRDQMRPDKETQMQPVLTLTDTPDQSMRQAIVRPLIHFNEVRSGQPEDYRPLVILIKETDAGDIVGGLWGGTNFTQLHIDLLFVSRKPPRLRRW